MIFTQQLWIRITPIYEAILVHPFNQSLSAGTLPSEVFSFYLAQDAHYLQEFARALALIAARAHDAERLNGFLKFAHAALLAESEMVHAFYRKQFSDKSRPQLTPACFSYTNYLLKTCSLAYLPVAIAAVLPCFWIYQQIGQQFASIDTTNHPYARWIETYGSADFEALVIQAQAFTDQAAVDASPTMQKQMSDAFYTSSVLEWHFWNDAYAMRSIDDFL